MKCQKCNFENEKGSKFCGNCGTPLEQKTNIPKKPLMTKNQKIFTLIAVIGIVAIGTSIHYSNILMGEPALVDHNFEVINMKVPDGSNFVLVDKKTQNIPNGFIGFMNKGEYGQRISSVFITSASDANITIGDVIEENRDMKLSYNATDTNIYTLQIKKPNCTIGLIGRDVDLMKKIAETIEVKNLDSIQPQSVVVNV